MSRSAAKRYRYMARESFKVATIGGCLLGISGLVCWMSFGVNWGLFLAALTFASIGFSMLFSWGVEYVKCNRIASELERDFDKYSTLD